VIADSGTLRLSEAGTTHSQPTPSPTPEPAVTESRTPSNDVKEIKEVTQAHASFNIDSSGNWFVQAGGFRNRQNAERRAELLRNAGYETRFVPRESTLGTIYQVRVGGFATKQMADSVSAELNKAFGFPTLVITSRLPRNSRTGFSSQQTLRTNEIEDSLLMDIHTLEDGHWYVQVGAFRNPKNVERMTERLRQANLQYKLVPSKADSTLMQVRVGGFNAKSESRNAADKLDSWLEMQTLVIRDRYRE
jgi:cell division protein FtsN